MKQKLASADDIQEPSNIASSPMLNPLTSISAKSPLKPTSQSQINSSAFPASSHNKSLKNDLDLHKSHEILNDELKILNLLKLQKESQINTSKKLKETDLEQSTENFSVPILVKERDSISINSYFSNSSSSISERNDADDNDMEMSHIFEKNVIERFTGSPEQDLEMMDVANGQIMENDLHVCSKFEKLKRIKSKKISYNEDSFKSDDFNDRDDIPVDMTGPELYTMAEYIELYNDLLLKSLEDKVNNQGHNNNNDISKKLI